MTCDINNKDYLRDVSSAALDGLNHNIDKLEKLHGKTPSVIGAIGKPVSHINNLLQLDAALKSGNTGAFVITLSGLAGSRVGAILGGAVAVAWVGSGIGIIGIALVGVGSYIGNEIGQKIGKELFDPTVLPSVLEEGLKEREAFLESQGLDPSIDPQALRLRQELLEARRRAGDCDMEEMHDAWNKAKGWQPPRDPIILDLDGNGLNTLGLNSGVYFDHDGSSILTRTGWVGEGDALLVWDRNVNGLIESGAELFGDFTPMPDGTLAPNGFAALAALDANGDGILDASDPAFAELKLWIDSDQNGVTSEGELISLADAGIASLNLGSTLKNQKQSNGNTLAREGSFTRTDGTESAMGEFHLAIDTFDTQFAEQIEVPEELRGLPMMNGSGNVRDLQQAATQSSSLQSLLGQFENSTDRFEQQRNWSLCA